MHYLIKLWRGEKMKFCEKLQKLRKEKGYSQEQLADMLDVSRQSVSKWESGTTYPEMDKLLSLCKIFEITLDDLTNDEISTNNIKEKSKNNLSNFVYAILDIINKSIEMFKSMDKKEIIKCITELCILFIILVILKLPFNYIDNLAHNIFANFSATTFNVLNSIWLFLSNTIYLILFITIFIYVYKIRFLDKYNYEQSIKSNEKKSDTPQTVDTEEVKQTTQPVAKEKHSFIFFDFLGTIFNIFIKVCLLFLIIPIIIFFVFLVICTTLSLILEFTGIHYIGIFIALFGATIASAIIMELFIRFLLNSLIPFKRMFIVFLLSLVTFGIGSGLSAYEFSKTKFIDSVPAEAKINTIEKTIAMQDDLVIEKSIYSDGINYIVDDSLNSDVNISIKYYEDYLRIENYFDDNKYVIRSYSLWNNTLNYFDLLKKDLKNKTIYNYELLGKVELTITTSAKNIATIKDNYKKHYEELNKMADQYDYYIDEINSLNEELSTKNDYIYDLEEKVTELQDKLDNIYNAIE